MTAQARVLFLGVTAAGAVGIARHAKPLGYAVVAAFFGLH